MISHWCWTALIDSTCCLSITKMYHTRSKGLGETRLPPGAISGEAKDVFPSGCTHTSYIYIYIYTHAYINIYACVYICPTREITGRHSEESQKNTNCTKGLILLTLWLSRIEVHKWDRMCKYRYYYIHLIYIYMYSGCPQQPDSDWLASSCPWIPASPVAGT